MSGARGRTGGCQCGSIRYRINDEARMLYACHCKDCQKQSASAFGLSLIVDVSAIEFTRGREQLRFWDTRGGDGGIKRCAFCPHCGSRIFHGSDDESAPISIKGGTLDETDWLHPVAHIWLRSAQPWIQIDPGQFACFDQEPYDEAVLEQRWRAQIAAS